MICTGGVPFLKSHFGGAGPWIFYMIHRVVRMDIIYNLMRSDSSERRVQSKQFIRNVVLLIKDLICPPWYRTLYVLPHCHSSLLTSMSDDVLICVIICTDFGLFWLGRDKIATQHLTIKWPVTGNYLHVPWREDFLLKTDSGYPKETGVNQPWQPLRIPSAITQIGQLHQSPPSPIPGDLGTGPSHQSKCSNIETRMDRPKSVVRVIRGVA
jgi:hypothetical protein